MGFEEDVARVMRWMYQRGLVQVRGGNASILDRARGEIVISPSGIPRPLVGPELVARILPDGTPVRGRPSSEWRMHAAIYRKQPRAVAVVHAHPRSVLALTLRGGHIDPGLMSEAGLQISCVGRVPYIRPGTWALAEAVADEAVRGCNAIIMERHGVAVWSEHSIYHALDILEALEDLAWISLHTG
ncbi:MAG: class II aldolase/adducin family protein [Desulfurococcales archaeon]|nr:class II aldolase/adducin family protein [Desulfurococcales archaeon]